MHQLFHSFLLKVPREAFLEKCSLRLLLVHHLVPSLLLCDSSVGPAPGQEPVWADEGGRVSWLQGNSLPTSEQRSACSWRPRPSVLPPLGKPEGGCQPVALLPACDICLLASISFCLSSECNPQRVGVAGGGRRTGRRGQAGKLVSLCRPWRPSLAGQPTMDTQETHVSRCPVCAFGTLMTVRQRHSY